MKQIPHEMGHLTFTRQPFQKALRIKRPISYQIQAEEGSHNNWRQAGAELCQAQDSLG